MKHTPKITLTSAISALLASSLLLTALLVTAKTETAVAQCVKVATAKENSAFKTAKSNYDTAVKKAPGLAGKIARVKALSEYKAAKQVAQSTFAVDRKACVSAASNKNK